MFVEKPVKACVRVWNTATTDHATGDFSLNHLVTIVTMGILSAAFMKNAVKFDLTWDDYVGYAVAMAMSASPALMAKFLGLKFGKPDGGG